MSDREGGAITFLEMRTQAVLGSIRVLNQLLEVALVALGVDPALRHDMALGLAELVANVCQHEFEARGLKDEDAGVEVALDARGEELVLTVASPGPRFDLDAALARAEARDPLDALDGSGLGLPLLKGLFDSLESQQEPQGGNRITLRKKR